MTRVKVADPYYAKAKTYLACPLACVLELGFGKPVAAYRGENFFLRARDGYVKPASGERLAEPGGWLAFADAEQPGATGWEPIDRRQVDPGPYYLVWSGPDQGDPHRHPWPYQLVAIEIAPFEARYPHTLPTGEPAGRAGLDGLCGVPLRMRRVSRDQRRRRDDRPRAEPSAQHRRVPAGRADQALHPRSGAVPLLEHARESRT